MPVDGRQIGQMKNVRELKKRANRRAFTRD